MTIINPNGAIKKYVDQKVASEATARANADSSLQTAVNGRVPTSRKVNGHALTADVTVTKGDVGLGSVEDGAKAPSTDATLASTTNPPTAKVVKDYVDGKFSGDLGTAAYKDVGTAAGNIPVLDSSGKLVLNNALMSIVRDDGGRGIDLLDRRYANATDPSENLFQSDYYLDKDSNPVGAIEHIRTSDGSNIIQVNVKDKADNWMSQPLVIVKNANAEYILSPTPSSKSENSTKIATTAWVNSASTVVHTTGNETIAGTKTFGSSMVVNAPDYNPFILKNPSRDSSAGTQAYGTGIYFRDKNNDDCGYLYSISQKTTIPYNVMQLCACNKKTDGTYVYGTINVYAGTNGTVYATAPTTPTSATSNEIATASWVNDKLSGVPTKTSISRPTVDQLLDAPVGAMLLLSYNDGMYEFAASLTKAGSSAWAGSGVANDGIIYRSVLYASVTADSGVTLYCGVPMNGNFGVSTISVTPTDEGVTLVYVE